MPTPKVRAALILAIPFFTVSTIFFLSVHHLMMPDGPSELRDALGALPPGERFARGLLCELLQGVVRPADHVASNRQTCSFILNALFGL
jgi:hypothetical protein